MFYEAVGLMLSADTDTKRREAYLARAVVVDCFQLLGPIPLLHTRARACARTCFPGRSTSSRGGRPRHMGGHRCPHTPHVTPAPHLHPPQEQLMSPPNQTWREIIAQAAAAPDVLKQPEVMRNLQVRVCVCAVCLCCAVCVCVHAVCVCVHA